MCRLARHLASTAEDFFSLAMEAYAARNSLAFYLNAGISIEHLAKARLALIHPTLVADPKHFPSILLLAQAPLDELPPPVFKTITVTEALTRCQSITPSLGALQPGLVRVIGHRNGGAHAGLVEPGRVSEDLTAVTQAIEVFLGELQLDRESFYGVFFATVEKNLSEANEVREVEVAAMIAAAEREFARRFSHSFPGYNVEEALTENDLYDPSENQRYECPACRSRAVLHGTSDPQWSPVVDEHGSLVGTELTVYFYPESLDCRLCGLSLWGQHLWAAGVPSEIELDDPNPDDFREFEESG